MPRLSRVPINIVDEVSITRLMGIAREHNSSINKVYQRDKSWDKEGIKEIVYSSKQNISAIISIIEDNSQQRVRIQTPISF